MHESFLACPNGAFFDYKRMSQCPRTPLGASCLTTNCDARAPHHKAWRVARQLILHGAGHLPGNLKDIIYISEPHLDLMRQYLPPGARLHHVANPVDVERDAPAEVASNDTFLFIGRLSAEKGCVLFAEAAAAAGVRAVFVGEGEARTEIQAANPAAVVTGWLPPVEVRAHLDRARCLVFPSLWREPLGLVVLEAAARGIPAIAMSWGGPVSTIVDGVTGLLVTTASVESLSFAVRQLTPAVAARLGRAAYERYWRNPPTQAAYIDRLLEVYEMARREQLRGAA
jgi:glycosyltransferase involved in cell wall biosynthesis